MRAKDSGGRVEGECEDVVTPVRGVARLRGGGVGEARERATSSSKPRRSGGGGVDGGVDGAARRCPEGRERGVRRSLAQSDAAGRDGLTRVIVSPDRVPEP